MADLAIEKLLEKTAQHLAGKMRIVQQNPLIIYLYGCIL